MEIDEKYYIRIQKIDFVNFRNIESGSIELPNSKPLIFMEGAPSILGLYGQNGSGKTSTIIALEILKDVLSGKAINKKFMSCVKEGCSHCSLSFTFSVFSRMVDGKENQLFSNNTNSCMEVFYNFDLVKKNYNSIDDYGEIKKEEMLLIENEIIRWKGIKNGKNQAFSKRILFDARKSTSDDKGMAFGSKTNYDFFAATKNDRNEYKMIKAKAMEAGKSFLFSQLFREKLIKPVNELLQDTEVIDEIQKYILVNGVNSEADLINNIDELNNGLQNNDEIAIGYAMILLCVCVYRVLNSFALFGRTYLQIVDTPLNGITNINTKLPIIIWQHTKGEAPLYFSFNLDMDRPTYVEERYYLKVSKSLLDVVSVLKQLVPNIELSILDIGKRINAKNVEEHGLEIMSKRDEHMIPLRYESDGIRRIVSILSLLIAAYNEESFTIAIDEIDAGIFEYLLGKVLEIMSESMRGQLIFTSHNLIPLEVLSSKYICFTTTDKKSRFKTINKRGNSNLRDTYIRLIQGNSNEFVYGLANKDEIKQKLRDAGFNPKLDK